MWITGAVVTFWQGSIIVFKMRIEDSLLTIKITCIHFYFFLILCAIRQKGILEVISIECICIVWVVAM